MMLRPFAVIGLATLTASATMASVQDARDNATPGQIAAARVAAMGGFELPEVDFDFRPPSNRAKTVQPARVFKKTPTEELRLPTVDNGKGFVGTGRVLVKFRNDARVRANLFPSNTLISAGGIDVDVVTGILDDYDATIQQLINKSPSELAKVTRKALRHSNRLAPDLASFTVVSFPDGIKGRELLALGRRLNDLHIVEWLSFETPVHPASPMGDTPRVVPADNPATETPNFLSNDGVGGGVVFGEWLTQAIPDPVPVPIPPADVFSFPPYTYQTNSIQQYMLSTATNAFADLAPENPETWFAASGFETATGYNLPGMIRLAGQAWRRYGSPPSDNPAFDVGSGPASGFLGSLPNPTRVWLYGAEFEIVDLTECNNGEALDAEGNPYECEDCYEVITRNADGSIPLKDATNPFPEFATDLYNLQIYENIKLCPTGRRTEIGVVDIAAFERHEEFIYDRYGDLIPEDERNVVFEEGQSMVLLEGPGGELLRNNASHGSAVIGALVAGNNNFGFTGMTWGSRVRFYPSLSSEEGARLSTAIISAISDLEPGSILCLPIQTVQGETGTDPEIGTFAGPNDQEPAQADFPPPAISGGQYLSSNGLYASLINLARDAGIVVVEAAGNAGEECAASAAAGEGEGDTQDLPSIIVTACTPVMGEPAASPFWGEPFLTNTDEAAPTFSAGWPSCGFQGFGTPLAPPATRWAGSNYFGAESEVNILGQGHTVSGWGMGIPTIGFGDLYRSQVPPEGIPQNEIDPLERDWLKSYTGPREGGTNPLPPLFNPFTSVEVSDGYLFGNEGNFGGTPWPHQSIQFQGTSAAATQIAGFSAWVLGFGQMFYDTPLSATQVLSAMGAIDSTDRMINGCEGEENDEGFSVGYPGATGGGVNNSVDPRTIALVPPVPNGPAAAIGVLTQIGQGFNGSVTIHYGDRIRGNKFSLAEEGDGNVLVIRSEPANMGQRNEGLTYLVTGETTDLGLLFESPADAEDIISMEVIVNRRVTLPGVFEVAYARDFTVNRYIPLGVNLLPDAFTEQNYQFGQAGTLLIKNFIDDDNNVDIRFYNLSFGFVGDSTFSALYDKVELVVNGDNAPL